jgi:hypothetical protein
VTLLGRAPRESAFRENRRALHEQYDVVFIDFALNELLYRIRHCFDLL